MVETVEQMIERRRLLEEVGGKVQKEQLAEIAELEGKRSELRQERTGRFIERAKSVRLPQSRPRITYKKSQRVGRAIKGVLGALVPQEALAGSVSFETKKKGDRGRGRPHGTYKARYVPGVGTVRVPTHIYRKMMSAAKSKRRLAEAERQAGIQQQYEAQQIAAEQIATSQDPRFQQSPGEDQFLEGPDMDYEAKLAAARQQQIAQAQYQQQVATQKREGIITKAGQMFGRVGGGLWGPQSRPPQMAPSSEPYSARQVQSVMRPQIDQNMFARSEPQVIVTRGKSIMFSKAPSILGQPNEFNKPEDALLERGGVRRKW